MKRLFPLVLALAAACANHSYGSAQVTNQLGDPNAVIDIQSEISVPEGSAASATVQLVDKSGDPLSGNLESEDPSVLEVFPVEGKANQYVFLGVKEGSTHVLILANGVQVATVSAMVTPPGSSSVFELPADGGVTPGFDGGADAGDDSGDDAADSGTDDASDSGDDAADDAGDSDAGDATVTDAGDAGDAAKHD
jgi:hypothetical protein